MILREFQDGGPLLTPSLISLDSPFNALNFAPPPTFPGQRSVYPFCVCVNLKMCVLRVPSLWKPSQILDSIYDRRRERTKPVRPVFTVCTLWTRCVIKVALQHLRLLCFLCALPHSTHLCLLWHGHDIITFSRWCQIRRLLLTFC